MRQQLVIREAGKRFGPSWFSKKRGEGGTMFFVAQSFSWVSLSWAPWCDDIVHCCNLRKISYKVSRQLYLCRSWFIIALPRDLPTETKTKPPVESQARPLKGNTYFNAIDDAEQVPTKLHVMCMKWRKRHDIMWMLSRCRMLPVRCDVWITFYALMAVVMT